MADLNFLAVLLQDLAHGRQVEADKAQQVRDVVRRRRERAQRGVQLLQLCANGWCVGRLSHEPHRGPPNYDHLFAYLSLLPQLRFKSGDASCCKTLA